MDTLALSLALLLDGRTMPTVATTQVPAIVWTMERTANVVAPTIVAALDTRAKIATKTPSIWGEK